MNLLKKLLIKAGIALNNNMMRVIESMGFY